jgi:hypothetical protein
VTKSKNTPKYSFLKILIVFLLELIKVAKILLMIIQATMGTNPVYMESYF